jgi:hypothetical protein
VIAAPDALGSAQVRDPYENRARALAMAATPEERAAGGTALERLR